MGWLAANNLLPFVAERYRAGAIGPMEYLFWLLCQPENALAITSDKEALAIIANCEAFAALGEQPSTELDLAAIGPRQWLMQRTLWNVDLLALQSLQLLGSSHFFKEEWNDDFDDLKFRLEKISARYEDHRQNPNRGVKVLNEKTGEWDDAETK